MRIILTILVMTIVAPVVVVTTLVFWNPERWGGSNPVVILGMAFFGVISTPLWPTYIPAMVAAPLVMSKIAPLKVFQRLPLGILSGIAVVIGAICGIAVISIIVPWRDSLDLVMNWVCAGAVSGAVALPAISLIYRWKPSAEQAMTLNRP